MPGFLRGLMVVLSRSRVVTGRQGARCGAIHHLPEILPAQRMIGGRGMRGWRLPLRALGLATQATVLQCRASTNDSTNDSTKCSTGGQASDGLLVAEPGVQAGEYLPHPIAVRPEVSAAGGSASDADSSADSAADVVQLDFKSEAGARETYTEVIAGWFWTKKIELQQLKAVPPAVTLFGKGWDSRRTKSPTDTVTFRERIKEVLNFRIWSSNGDSNALETVGKAGNEAPAVEEGPGSPEHPAAAALRSGGHTELAFGFSAGGLLFPYYIGVIFRLHELGVVTRDTKLGGASAGSLIAACYHSGISESTITEACFVLCENCRNGGTRGRLRSVLQTFLEDLLPEDIHERCNGRAFVAVTQVFPRPKGLIISEFTSKEDFIAALLTSCHIPWWFDSSIWTTFRGALSYDGGLTNFIPLPPALCGIRVSCFPGKQVSGVYDIAISPDTFESWPHSMNQMVGWAFEPAEDDILRMYIAKGRADAEAWAETTGVLKVLAALENGQASRGGQSGASTVLNKMTPTACLARVL